MECIFGVSIREPPASQSGRGSRAWPWVKKEARRDPGVVTPRHQYLQSQSWANSGQIRADGQLCGRLVGGLCSQIPGDGIDASWCILDGPCPAASAQLQTGSRVEDSTVFSLVFLKK